MADGTAVEQGAGGRHLLVVAVRTARRRPTCRTQGAVSRRRQTLPASAAAADATASSESLTSAVWSELRIMYRDDRRQVIEKSLRIGVRFKQ